MRILLPACLLAFCVYAATRVYSQSSPPSPAPGPSKLLPSCPPSMMSNISSEWPKPGWLQRTLYGDGEGALREIAPRMSATDHGRVRRFLALAFETSRYQRSPTTCQSNQHYMFASRHLRPFLEMPTFQRHVNDSSLQPLVQHIQILWGNALGLGLCPNWLAMPVERVARLATMDIYDVLPALGTAPEEEWSMRAALYCAQVEVVDFLAMDIYALLNK